LWMRTFFGGKMNLELEFWVALEGKLGWNDAKMNMAKWMGRAKLTWGLVETGMNNCFRHLLVKYKSKEECGEERDIWMDTWFI
jgi:hypothetical protein